MTKLVVPALVASLAAALAWTGWLAWQRSARIAELERANREMQARAVPAAAPAQPSPSPQPAPSPSPPPRQAPAPALPDRSEAEALKARLGEARAELVELENRVHDLQAQAARLAADNQRLSASEADLNENLSSANRVIAAQQTELKGKGDRITQLEVVNQQLREQAKAGSGRLAETMKLAADLQDIHRRREAVLNAVLRRYKDVSAQYRALEARGRDDAPAVNTADLERIQNSIAMAEDDLRQLSALNAQAQRLQKLMAQK
ncbi:MAG: hypothetical protein ACE15B_10715 [Bryobacteraceae bacterium]